MYLAGRGLFVEARGADEEGIRVWFAELHVRIVWRAGDVVKESGERKSEFGEGRTRIRCTRRVRCMALF